VVALAVQYGIFHRLLGQLLRSRDLVMARPAIGLWLKVVIVWQLVVLVASGVYIAVLASRHVPGGLWVAPAVGAVFGTAMPLQIAVFSLLRSARG
jgi:hypothetical protein